jgi:hypothetical protein
MADRGIVLMELRADRIVLESRSKLTRSEVDRFVEVIQMWRDTMFEEAATREEPGSPAPDATGGEVALPASAVPAADE